MPFEPTISFRQFAILAAIAVARLPGRASAAGCPGADSRPSAVSKTRITTATLCLLNAQRRHAGRRPLRTNARLAHAGMVHVRDMVDHDYFAHNSRDGARFDARIRATG